MVRTTKEVCIGQYKKACHQFYKLQYEYRYHVNLRSTNFSVYRKLKSLELKIKKLKSSPYITLELRRRIPNDVRLSIYGESSEEDENDSGVEELTTGVHRIVIDEDDSRPPAQDSPNRRYTDANDAQHCENFLRKQNQHLISTFGEKYTLHFVERSVRELRRFNKFKFAPRDDINIVHLCQECDAFLVTEENKTKAKEAKYTWPSFILSVLTNSNVASVYGIKVWQLIPTPWRYWWVDTIHIDSDDYGEVSISNPKPIIFDQTMHLFEWRTKIDSKKLFEISNACNKYMIPFIMRPWGCNEFIFRCGQVSIDIIYQRYLRKVKLKMISDLDRIKYVAYCRDDYFRFDEEYDCLLLNKDWKVVPSVCLMDDGGACIMTCKDHDKGCFKCMIHPPRQPNHNLSSQYADQLCHAVIKPRTVTTSKANAYSNTYIMHEQRGNFNGIDTCSITQYRKFKLLSYLLQENELRSLKGRPDINALLSQLVEEKDLAPEIVENYRTLADKMELDIDALSYGATYVPINAAIEMGRDKVRDVFWDDNAPTETRKMTPSFPSFLHPVQACNVYGCAPHTIPFFQSTGAEAVNTSMLWLCCGLLSTVEEIWTCVYKMPLYQSMWNGWLQTYIANKIFHHVSPRAKPGDPFSMILISSITKLMEKMVSKNL